MKFYAQCYLKIIIKNKSFKTFPCSARKKSVGKKFIIKFAAVRTIPIRNNPKARYTQVHRFCLESALLIQPSAGLYSPSH